MPRHPDWVYITIGFAPSDPALPHLLEETGQLQRAKQKQRLAEYVKDLLHDRDDAIYGGSPTGKWFPRGMALPSPTGQSVAREERKQASLNMEQGKKRAAALLFTDDDEE